MKGTTKKAGRPREQETAALIKCPILVCIWELDQSRPSTHAYGLTDDHEAHAVFIPALPGSVLNSYSSFICKEWLGI